MNTLSRHAIGAAALMLAASSFATDTLAVSREVTIDRAPATVWKLIGDFNALDVWLPPVLGSALASNTRQGNGTAPGAIRVLDLVGNARVTEKLVGYDGTRHRYSYAFIESPLPVKNYVATIELSAAPGGRTLIKWHSTFDAAGAADDKAKEAILGIYDAGLAKVATIFRKSTTP